MIMKLTPEDIAYLRQPNMDEIAKRIEGGLLIRVLESLDPCTYPHCMCSNICKNINHEYRNVGSTGAKRLTGR